MIFDKIKQANPEIDGICRREINRSNYASIYYFLLSGVPFCLLDIVMQYIFCFINAVWVDIFLLVYYMIGMIFYKTVLPKGYSHSTGLLYILEAPVLLLLIMSATIFTDAHHIMTVFAVLLALPLLIFDGKKNLMCWIAGWSTFFMICFAHMNSTVNYQLNLFYSLEFTLGSLAVTYIVTAWRQEKLRKYAAAVARNYDALTGLPNFFRFMNTAEEHVELYLEDDRQPTMVYFNIANLKQYNAKHGYQAGSDLLRQVASIIKSCFPDGITARISQNHFIVLCDEEDVEDCLRDVYHQTNGLNEEAGMRLKAGIYNVQRGDEIGTAVDHAKTAADSIRGHAGIFCRVYDEEFRREVLSRQYILDNVDRAVKEGWIKTWYQPIVRAATGQLCSEEALTRWQDPESGMIPPDRFVPVLEENRLIYKVDLCNVKNVLQDLQEKKKKGLPLSPVSINLSRTDFTQMDMAAEIGRMADQAGIERQYLIIEITESTIVTNGKFLREIIAHFHAEGFLVWMDDFGSGYSSLNLVADYNFDLLKFDIGFMRGLKKGSNKEIVLTSVVEMAKKLGVETLAEGVETEEQYEILKTMGCSRLQGYYFSSPKPHPAVMSVFPTDRIKPVEDPAVAEYMQKISGINLNDPLQAAKSSMPDIYHVVPSAVIEICKDGKFRIARANREFMQFLEEASIVVKEKMPHEKFVVVEPDQMFADLCRRAVESGKWASNSDGGLSPNIPIFVRYLGSNPVTESKAVVTAILCGKGVLKKKSIK